MKSNFYEKIIPIESEEKKNLIIKMNKLLDESIETLINLRKRKMDEIENPDIKSKIIDRFNEFRLSQNNDNNSNENNNNNNSNNSNHNYIVSRLGELRRQGHVSRLQRILNLEQESVDLDRLINENPDVVG